MVSRSRRNTFAVIPVGILLASLGACSDDSRSRLVEPEIVRSWADTQSITLASVPSNDDFDDAVVVTSLPFSHEVDTSEATTDPDDPVCFGQGPTVWYAFTAWEDMFVEANTVGSDYDTTLGAYTGERGDLTELACNDDDAGLQSRVIVPVQEGETVHFMVGAWSSGPGGNLVFNMAESGPPPPPPPPLEVAITLDRFGSVDPKTGLARVHGTMHCSRPAHTSVFGQLEGRLGRVRVRAQIWDVGFCDGSGTWQADVEAENVLLTAGRYEGWVEGFFWDPEFGEFAWAQDSGTVQLRGAALTRSQADSSRAHPAISKRRRP